MPIGIKLDSSTHDIVFSNGAIETVNDGEKLAQDLKTRLKTNLGEVLLDNKYGFPYRLVFQSKRLNLSEVETLIKQYILSTEGVKRITQFFIDYSGGNDRRFKISFSVEATEAYLVDKIQVIL